MTLRYYSPANLAALGSTVLSAEDSAGDLTPANLATRSPADLWRSSTGSAPASRWCGATLAADAEVGVVALRWDRDSLLPGPADTIRLRADLAAGTFGAGAVLDSGAVACGVDPLRGYWVYRIEPAITAAQFRLDLTLAGETRVEAGSLWIGARNDLSHGPAYGWSLAPAEDGEVRHGPSGRSDARPLKSYWRLDGRLAWLSAAEREAWLSADFALGRTRPLLFCLDADNPATSSIVGYQEAEAPVIRRSFALGEKSLRIREDV